VKKDLRVYLDDILESIINIQDFCRDIAKEDFARDKMRQSAVMRELQIIGEAAKAIPDNVRKEYPEIPWEDITGTRDVITHRYHDIDLDVIWEVVEYELSDLKESVENMMRDLDNR
jgi:uncharacterized protein with HEPN domain